MGFYPRVGLSIDACNGRLTRVSTVNTSPATALAGQSDLPVSPEDRAKTLARLVIREGKPFNASALQAGYSEATSKRGLAGLMANSSIVTDAVKRESDAIQTNIHTLKPLAITRLYREIADAESGANGLRAIELAGRFKETDWFVRNTGDAFGVFLTIGESAPNTEVIDIATEYKE